MSVNLYQASDRDRRFSEEDLKTHSSQFRRDYARLIHSASFRRMQGKTQIYPGIASDFFRNRLTHSLEVAQIAKSMAIIVNDKYNLNIDYDLIETAALCHDIGHPPFGHNGEQALHHKMRDFGGFEGNAQTLRILSRSEKKLYMGKDLIKDGVDNRLGLNFTYRTLASILKYDNKIPPYIVSESPYPVKGYYACDHEIVEDIKKNVLSGFSPSVYEGAPFKTIECSIMDLADDIAYSTYDIEDAFKGGFLDPVRMVGADSEILEKVQQELYRSEGLELSIEDIRQILVSIFNGFIDFDIDSAVVIHQKSKALAETGYLRTEFTSRLVHRCISNVHIRINYECPLLSKVYLEEELRIHVEVLKVFIFISVITAPTMNIIRYRGRDIISNLFDLLMKSKPDSSLLPLDIGALFFSYGKDDWVNKSRIVSDYISSMTDRHAVELYSRFNSDIPHGLFKPLI
jgi:dGTPase